MTDFWEIQASSLIEALRRAADSEDEIERWLKTRDLDEPRDRLRTALFLLEGTAKTPAVEQSGMWAKAWMLFRDRRGAL